MAWTREACERSGVTVGVSDPVALAKLRVLTRPEEWRAWLDGIRAEELQRPLPDEALSLVEGPG